MNSFEKDWDTYAAEIDQRKDSPEWEVLRKARETHWSEFFSVQKSDKILDAGCGLGDYTVFALKEDANVWAFDYSHEMVNCTAARIKNLRLKAEAVSQQSIVSIDYPNEMFDKVFCLAVLDHLPEPDRMKALKELTRVLKPGGLLYLDVPNRFAYHWRLIFELMKLFKLYPGGEIHFFTPGELKQLIRFFGLLPQNSLGLTILPPFSGLYTTDIRRITFLPDRMVTFLDRLYLKIEITLRRIDVLKPLCWHYFISALKPES